MNHMFAGQRGGGEERRRRSAYKMSGEEQIGSSTGAAAGNAKVLEAADNAD
jgi:hypothetical protein